MRKELQIAFRDELGGCILTVDEHGVSFCDGVAYFTDKDTNKDYQIETNLIFQINYI